MMEKYNDIEKWRFDTSALITDFFFLGNKSTKSIANGFINDITLESLIIIDSTFGGSIEGFNVKYPAELAEHPVFSYRSTQLNFELYRQTSARLFLRRRNKKLYTRKRNARIGFIKTICAVRQTVSKKNIWIKSRQQKRLIWMRKKR